MIEYIKELDNDSLKYLDVINQPWFTDNKIPQNNIESNIKIFQAVGGYIQEIPNNIARGVKESRIGSELNFEKYMIQLNTLFGDLTDIIGKGANLPPQQSIGNATSYKAMNDPEDLNQKIKGSSNSSNNQPPSQLAVNFELNVKNESGQFIDKKAMTQVFNLNNTQNLANKVSHTMDLRAMG